MSKTIIGIHGLGNKPPKKILHNWWKKSICDGLNHLGLSFPFFHLEMVYWAPVLYQEPMNPRIADQKSPLYIEDPYIPPTRFERAVPSMFKQKIREYIERQLDKLILTDDSLTGFEAISDIIIRRYFKDLLTYYCSDCRSTFSNNGTAREEIQAMLLSALRRHRRSKILLISHSMGSLIAYDVLTQYSTELSVDTWITCGSPMGIPVIMRKIAQEQNLKISKSGQLPTPDSIKTAWYNFSDFDDKVAFNYNLADDYSPNQRGIKPTDKIVLNTYEHNGVVNPHKSYGYLRVPEMADIIRDFLLRDSSRFKVWINEIFYRLGIRNY